MLRFLFLSFFFSFSLFSYENREVKSYMELANSRFNEGAYKEAIDNYFRALIYDPTLTEAHFGLGKSYQKLGQISDAIREYQSTIIFDPLYSDAYKNLALIYLEKGQGAEALSLYFKALSFNSRFPDEPAKLSPRRKNEIEQLKSQNLKDKTLFIYSDLSIEDSLLFSRYLTALQKEVKKILFQPNKSLYKLYKNSFKGIEVISWLQLEEDLSFDLKVPFAALPSFFEAIVPPFFLQINKKEVEELGKWVNKGKKNVGLALKTEENRAFFEQLPSKLNYYSLQTQTLSLEVTELIDDNDTIEELSAAITNLDLIVTSNQEIAVLAATLGKPVWLLLQKEEWPWWKDLSWFEQFEVLISPTPQAIKEKLTLFKD
jgi:tetratricopeptide (TPR) repeat protein